jgi:hypothetical protein
MPPLLDRLIWLRRHLLRELAICGTRALNKREPLPHKIRLRKSFKRQTSRSRIVEVSIVGPVTE